MNRTGVTLVELIIVLAIIGIIVLFATIDTAWFQRDARVTEARDRLLADVEEVKLKSLAQVPHAIFVTDGNNTSYSVVQLKDYKCSVTTTKDCLTDTDCTGGAGNCTVTGNFKRDVGEETSTLSTVTLQTGMRIQLTGTNELWFDRKGIQRTSNWGAATNRTFRLWYDEIANGVIDWTEVGDLDNENKCNEPCRLIKINISGRIQYEK